MKIIQVYENINKIKTFDDYSEFDVLMMMSSAFLWNKYNKTKPDLYCDIVTLDLLEKLNITHLWGSIDTTVLNGDSKLNKKNFWASSKLLVMDTIQEPFIIFDVDFLPYCNLEKLIEDSNEDVIYSHDEDGENVYLTKNSPELKSLQSYPLFNTWSTESLNVSFLVFHNMELKNKYVSMAINTMNELNNLLGENNTNFLVMTFCEQKILKEILLNDRKYTYKTLIKEYFECATSTNSKTLNSINYFWEHTESLLKFKHYGPSKKLLKTDDNEIKFFERILYSNFNNFNIRKLLKTMKILFYNKSIPNIVLFKYFIDSVDTDKLFNYIFLTGNRKKNISYLIHENVEVSVDTNGSTSINFDFIKPKGITDYNGIQILVKNVWFNDICLTEYSKQYHYTDKDSYYTDDVNKNKLLVRFNLNDFFDFYHLSKNYFKFEDQFGKIYYLISNGEFLVDFEYYHEYITCNIHFSNLVPYNIIICNEDNFQYYNDITKKRNIYLQHTNTMSYDIMDYYVFDNYRLTDCVNSNKENIIFIKNELKELFDGLKYYFCGSSIFRENVKDIDLYVCNDVDYNKIRQILNSHSDYTFVKNTDNSIRYINTKFNIPIDAIKECVTYSNEYYNTYNELSLRDLYLDLCHAYTNTLMSGCTLFRKKYRYNKVLELYNTVKLFPEWNNFNFDYSDNIVTGFDTYFKLINDNQFEEISISYSNSCLAKLLYKDYYYYLIVKPKIKQTDKFNISIPFLIKDIEVITHDTTLKDILIINCDTKTDIEINIIKKYCMIRFKKA